MRTKLIYLIIFAFCANLIFYPVAQTQDLDACISAGTQVSAKSDVFFTGYVSLMMKLALGIVSDGTTIPAPLKSAKKGSHHNKAGSPSNSIWITDSSMCDNINSSNFVSKVIPYISYSMPSVKIDYGRNNFWLLNLFVFLAFMLFLYALPRGAIDGNIISIHTYAKMSPLL